MRALPDIFAKLGFKDDFIVRTRLQRQKGLVVGAASNLQELIVKMTATGAENTALNPENALDSDDSYAQMPSVPGPVELNRDTGNHDGSTLGIIHKIEALVEMQGSGENDTYGFRAAWDDAAFLSIDLDLFPTDTVEKVDVTDLRSWLWSDFDNDSKLSLITTNAVLTNYLIDQLAYVITYSSIWTVVAGSMLISLDANGRYHIERVAAGAEDHVIKNTFTSQDWSEFDTIRFRIQKVVYAGTNPLTFEIYATTKKSVDVKDYCFFDSTTEETICQIPLADFSGADLTDVEGIGFTMDGDDGDYDFFVDDFETVKLDDEDNVEYYDGLDTNVQGYSDIGNGIETRTQAGRVTEKAGVFYLPKDTEITLFDYIIYNDETYAVIGINDDYPTHLVVDAVFREVWN